MSFQDNQRTHIQSYQGRKAHSSEEFCSSSSTLLFRTPEPLVLMRHSPVLLSIQTSSTLFSVLRKMSCTYPSITKFSSDNSLLQLGQGKKRAFLLSNPIAPLSKQGVYTWIRERVFQFAPSSKDTLKAA